MNIKSFIIRATNKVLRNTRWYNQYFGGAIKFWRNPSFDLDFVNLGSNSGLYSFNYSELSGIKGANWALGPQSLVHDFNILKNYFSFIREGGTLSFVLSPFSFLVSPYSKQQNLKYYTFLHPATVIDFEESEREKALRFMYYPFMERPLFCIKQTLKECIKRCIPRRHRKVNFDEDAARWIRSWKKQFGINDLEAPLLPRHVNDTKLRTQTLHEMVEFCNERNIRPVIVIPPMHKSLAKLITEKVRNSYTFDLIDKANVGDTKILNYIDWHMDDDCFQNAYFLNEKGAKLFTQRVLTDLGIL